jgi:hypothetical protein
MSKQNIHVRVKELYQGCVIAYIGVDKMYDKDLNVISHEFPEIEDAKKYIQSAGATAVMFSVSSMPRKSVPIDRAEKHLSKFGRIAANWRGV